MLFSDNFVFLKYRKMLDAGLILIISTVRIFLLFSISDIKIIFLQVLSIWTKKCIKTQKAKLFNTKIKLVFMYRLSIFARKHSSHQIRSSCRTRKQRKDDAGELKLLFINNIKCSSKYYILGHLTIPKMTI